MKVRIPIATMALVAMLLPAHAAADDVWRAWSTETQRQCPAHHVDWISGGGYDELLGGFVQTLPSVTRRGIDRIADYSRRCADETMGFSCEMAANLDAFRRLGLLKRVTAFGCRHYKCTEMALCHNL